MCEPGGSLNARSLPSLAEMREAKETWRLGGGRGGGGGIQTRSGSSRAHRSRPQQPDLSTLT